jgi:hypothetical protein
VPTNLNIECILLYFDRMATDLLIDHELVKNSTKLLSILSKKDNFTIFLFASRGLKADSSTLQKLGLTRKRYYTRLRQLMEAGLINKSDGSYFHTTLGRIIYQKYLIGLMQEIANTKQMKMIDTLKRTKQFSEDDIIRFVSKITDSTNITKNMSSASKIEIAWTLEDMVSAIVERVEFCKNEILIATRSFNEIIINNILRKASSEIMKVKVIADARLIKEYFQVEEHKTLDLNDDKNSTERTNVVTNPWCQNNNNNNINRRIYRVPYSIIVLDGEEVGVELIDWNEPKKLHGIVFIKDENTCKIIRDFYLKLWDSAASLPSSFKQEEKEKNKLQQQYRQQKRV